MEDAKTLTRIFTKAQEIGSEGLERLADALDAVVQPAAQGVDHFARDNDISRCKVYSEINAGRLKTMKVGSRRLITREAGAEWRRQLEDATAADQPQAA